MKEVLKTTKDRRGWLVPYLTALDEMFFRRWDYWYKAIKKDAIPRDPIPYIPFQMPMAYQKCQVGKNLKKCLDYAAYSTSNTFEHFIDWILWGLNYESKFPEISERIDDYWYRNFNLGLFYKEPADHFADLAAEYMGRGSGYFPTPANVVDMMVRMNFGDTPQHKHKKMSVCDPCAGSGIILLYASNYSLNLYGVDINPLITKVAIVNSYIYVPWLACRPSRLTMFDRKKQGIIEIELPTGIKIPECQGCNGKSRFLMDIQTDHKVTVTNGLLTVNKPTLSTDIIARRLRPENITCATCFKEI